MNIIIPSSINEIKEKEVFLSGGTEIMRNKGEGTALFETVYDISHIVSSSITKEGDVIKIGAMATFNDMISSPLTPEYLKEASRLMASWVLRNSATLGGNIAAELDSSYLLPVLIASDSTLIIWKGKEEEISLVDYLSSDEDSLILYVLVKDMDVYQKCYRRASHMHSIINYARAINEAIAIKNEGIFINEDELNLSDDECGSAEYKNYLISIERNKGGSL